jgi:hypothetical protein
MPPPHRHRSTIIVKVERPWAGVVRLVPHGAYVAGKCCGMRRAGCRGFLHRFLWGFYPAGNVAQERAAWMSWENYGAQAE